MDIEEVQHTLRIIEQRAKLLMMQAHEIDPISGYDYMTFDDVDFDTVYMCTRGAPRYEDDYGFDMPLRALFDDAAERGFLESRRVACERRAEAKRQAESQVRHFKMVSESDWQAYAEWKKNQTVT